MSTQEVTATIDLIVALAGLATALTAYLKSRTAHKRIDVIYGNPPQNPPDDGAQG